MSEKEIKALKNHIKTTKNNIFTTFKVENISNLIIYYENLQQRIDKAIKYVEDYKEQWCRNDEVINDMNELLSILKGENK